MIPHSYKDIYKGGKGRSNSQKDIDGITERQISHINSDELKKQANIIFSAYEAVVAAEQYRKREDGLPLVHLIGSDVAESHYTTIYSVFSYIGALCSLGLQSRANNVYDHLRSEKILTFRDKVLPVWYMKDAEKRDSVLRSYEISTYMQALCAIGKKDEAIDVHTRVSSERLLTTRKDRLPITAVREDGAFLEEKALTIGALAYIDALAEMGLAEEAHNMHNSLNKAGALTCRADGFPSWQISHNNVVSNSGIASCIIFAALNAYSGIGEHRKSLELYCSAKLLPLLTHRHDGLPIERLDEDYEVPHLPKVASFDVFLYIRALMRLSEDLNRNGEGK